MSHWASHLKSILYSKRNVVIPSNSDNAGHLDYAFNMEELSAASSILNAGECPGLDNIANEMIIYIFNTSTLMLYYHLVIGSLIHSVQYPQSILR